MKKQILIITTTILLGINCYGQNEVSLREELGILKPFISKTWISEEKHPSGQMVLHFNLKFESIYNGKVIKMYMECPDLNFQTNGYFYYDSDKKEIAFLELSSNGNISQGYIKKEDGKVVKYGNVIFSDRKLEFKNIFEFTTEGSYSDKYFRLENGEWKPGHSRVYNEKPENDTNNITSEILKKYKELNGVIDDKKVDLWDTYFLNHHLIGNTHNNNSKIGWETFHNVIMEDKLLPEDKRFYAETYDITVYPINKNTAWVKGKLKMVYPDGMVSENYFYDSLIKTDEGWRVFNSVVNSVPK